MNDHIQRRRRTSATPPRSSAQNPETASAARAAGTEPIRIRKTALTRKVTESTAIAAPGPTVTTRTPAERRPEHGPDVLREPHQRVRLLQVLGPGDLRNESAGGRPEEGLEGPVDRHEHREHPQLGGTREQQHRDHRLYNHPSEIGHEHEPSARQPVGPDAGRQDQQRRAEAPAPRAPDPVRPRSRRARRAPRRRGPPGQRVADEGDRLAGQQHRWAPWPQRSRGNGGGCVACATWTPAGATALRESQPRAEVHASIAARSMRRATTSDHSSPMARTRSAEAAWSYSTRRCSIRPSPDSSA